MLGVMVNYFNLEIEGLCRLLATKSNVDSVIMSSTNNNDVLPHRTQKSVDYS